MSNMTVLEKWLKLKIKSNKMSLKNKLIFGFLCILLSIGTYSAHLTYEVLKFKLENQLTIKGKNITESTGIALGNLILTNDYIKIQKVINSIMAMMMKFNI